MRALARLVLRERFAGVDVTELTQRYRRHMVEAMHDYTVWQEDARDDDVGLLLVAGGTTVIISSRREDGAES